MNGPHFILVHGSWHTGEHWVPVQKHLADAGITALAPTLPGHGHNVSRDVIHDDYVTAVVDLVDAQDQPVVLVGHSFGGSIITRVAERRPTRCRHLIYYSAFVPRDGECVADSLPEEFTSFLHGAAQGSRDGSAALPFEIFHPAFANTVDFETAHELHATLVPEPVTPVFERLRLPNFAAGSIPVSYVACTRDRALPPGTFHPGQSGRLTSPKIIELDGDHEALLTSPRRLADALLTAAETALHV